MTRPTLDIPSIAADLHLYRVAATDDDSEFYVIAPNMVVVAGVIVDRASLKQLRLRNREIVQVGP